MLKLYDQSLLNRITGMYPYTYFTVRPNHVEEVVNQLQEKNETLVYPHIIVARIGVPKPISDLNQHNLRHGRFFQEVQKSEKTMQLDLQYQVDIRSKRREEVDQLAIEFQWAIMKNPSILTDLGGDYGELKTSLVISEQEDNTDIENFGESPRVYRYTFTLDTIVTIVRVLDATNIIEDSNITVQEV
jgi:hypothetical protein